MNSICLNVVSSRSTERRTALANVWRRMEKQLNESGCFCLFYLY